MKLHANARTCPNSRRLLVCRLRGQGWPVTEAALAARVTERTVCSGYLLRAHAIARRALGVRHTRIRPGRPRTNGKAERSIQTPLDEWAYVRIYGSSKERERQLQPYLERYNFSRPHGSLGKQPPGSRLTKVVRNYN